MASTYLNTAGGPVMYDQLGHMVDGGEWTPVIVLDALGEALHAAGYLRLPFTGEFPDPPPAPPNTTPATLGDLAAALTGAVDDTRIPTAITRDSELAAALAGFAPPYASLTGAPWVGGNIQTTARKLADVGATGDVSILVLGDSTAATSQFASYLLPAIQAMYPHRTLMQTTWGGSSYPALAQVGPAGTGTTKINFYLGAQGGTVPESIFATWEERVAAIQPDLIIAHYGHNYGATAAGGGSPSDAAMDADFVERMTRFMVMLRHSCPSADVLINSQNPYLTAGTRDGLSSIRAQRIRSLAADLGAAYGPVCEAYLATGNPTAYLGVDLLHPNVAGAQLTSAALLPMFAVNPRLSPTVRPPSPLSVPGVNLLVNGNFAAFAAPPTLTGWTAGNAALAKIATAGSFESVNGYALSITAVAAGVSQAYQLLPIGRVRGQVITFAARVFAPTASTNEAGRIGLSGDGGLVGRVSGTLTNCKNQWVWTFVTVRVPAAATFVTASLRGGSTAGDMTYVDRAVCVLGHMPRDI